MAVGARAPATVRRRRFAWSKLGLNGPVEPADALGSRASATAKGRSMRRPPSVSIATLAGIGVLLMTVDLAVARELTVHASAVSGGADWINPAGAEHQAEADCQNALFYARNEVRTSTQYLEADMLTSLSALFQDEVIIGVFVDVNGRYDEQSSNNRFGLRVRGSVPTTTLTSPTWSQGAGNDACAFRFTPPYGWDITSLRAGWIEQDIQNLLVAVRRFDNNDTIGTSLARVNAFKVTIITGCPQCSVAPGSLMFPATQIGAFCELSFRITNTGAGFLSGTVSGCSTPFAVIANGSYVLGPMAFQDVWVRFQPDMPGMFNCNLAPGPGCATVSLNGAGLHPVSTPETTPALELAVVGSRRSGVVLHYSIPAHGHVSLDLYDLAGRRVRRLVDTVEPAGGYVVEWDRAAEGGRVAAGVYIARLRNRDQTVTRKVVVVP